LRNGAKAKMNQELAGCTSCSFGSLAKRNGT
jgi:hypothetical protein